MNRPYYRRWPPQTLSPSDITPSRMSMSMARYNIVFNVDYKTMAFCRRTFAPRLSTIRTMPIRCATQRPQMMAMDAATGYGDSMIVEVKYSEPRTIYSNCNINFIKLIYDTRFLMSPKYITSRRIYSTRRRRPAKSQL